MQYYCKFTALVGIYSDKTYDIFDIFFDEDYLEHEHEEFKMYLVECLFDELSFDKDLFFEIKGDIYYEIGDPMIFDFKNEIINQLAEKEIFK